MQARKRSLDFHHDVGGVHPVICESGIQIVDHTDGSGPIKAKPTRKGLPDWCRLYLHEQNLENIV